MFIITDKNCIINLNNITCIYVKTFTVNGVKGGRIMAQFSETAEFSDEVTIREYNNYDDAVNSLYDLAIMLEAKKV